MLVTKPGFKKESEMGMMQKLNIDNDLEEWKTYHQTNTCVILYFRDRSSFSVSASDAGTKQKGSF